MKKQKIESNVEFVESEEKLKDVDLATELEARKVEPQEDNPSGYCFRVTVTQDWFYLRAGDVLYVDPFREYEHAVAWIDATGNLNVAKPKKGVRLVGSVTHVERRATVSWIPPFPVKHVYPIDLVMNEEKAIAAYDQAFKDAKDKKFRESIMAG